MPYPWNTIKKIIERTEYDKVMSEFSLLEQQEGFAEKRLILTDKTKGYLDFLGKLSIGVSVGIFTIIFNFLLFTWVLHMEENTQEAGTFKKTSETRSTTVAQSIVQQNKLGVLEYENKDSKETKHKAESIAIYGGQTTKWVSNRLESGIAGFLKGAHLVADKVLESVGWGSPNNDEIDKNLKTTGTMTHEEQLTKAKEIKEDSDGLQQQNDMSETVYTVQTGAFRDHHRADALKAKLIKKGYNAYLSCTESEGAISIFNLCKVLIGEFTHREEAEKLSSEIGESESLQAFVTPKKDSIRYHNENNSVNGKLNRINKVP